MNIPTIFGHLYKTFVQESFKQAALAFEQDPSSENWAILEVTMWAWQSVQQHSLQQSSSAAMDKLLEAAVNAKGEDFPAFTSEA